ncbi:hypothetical protein DL96DRAFT_1468986 [Flagelloscypha sp. PMI_526]|nr:hypothetical protein DL96DRAFT_1468986 [Flagelloscypha sp. PMI_526]
MDILTSQTSDILFTILSYLDVGDMLALRMSCHHFKHLTMQRTVWVPALVSLIRNLSLAPATFPISTMSTPEIEHAATAHLRFRRNIELHSGAEARVYSRRKVACLAGSVDCVRMIPGGRFLLLVRGDILELWDLARATDEAEGLVCSIPCRLADESPFVYLCIYTGDTLEVKLAITEGSSDSWYA